MYANALMAIAVVLDTNVLLLPFQRRIDVETEVERLIEEPHYFVVLQQVIDELVEMAQQRRQFSSAARAALLLVSKSGFVVERGFPGKPDGAMLEFCKAKNGVLATLDAALRRKARQSGLRVVFLRGKAHLALV